VTDPREHPAVRRVVEAAAQRGVVLEIRSFPESTHTAEQAARAVGARLGQIVKSLVFASAREDGSVEEAPWAASAST
jgi:prolyl-tRNA editing enzyme YbaK/EbsC (Cys-tRNA(Pro) deacylase)